MTTPLELTNFTVWGKQWFTDGWEGLRAFCEAHGLAGVELLGAGLATELPPPAELVHGVHLLSLGSWLPLAGLPVQDFGDASGRYAELDNYEALVEARAAELRAAAVLEPEYVVWHGSYAPDKQRLPGGRGFLTTPRILSTLGALVRDVFAEYTPPFRVCFENAYGFGVGPDAVEATGEFLGNLADFPVGLVLDVGHHLNRDRDIATPEAACRELLRVGQEFAAGGVAVDVLHLHWTPPELVPEDLAPGSDAGCFFEQCDQHRPLAHPLLAEAVGAVGPQIVVHEMGAMSLEDHSAWLTEQTTAMRGLRQ